MSEPFLAEIRIFGFNFSPRGWAFCNGQILPIAQNTALFSLVGTTYGGDGRTTFGLPDLQGRAPIFWGQGPGLSDYILGENGGTTSVTLTTNQLPGHTHTVQAVAANGSSNTPVGNDWGKVAAGRGALNLYNPASDGTSMNAAAFPNAGGSQPHNNMAPYLSLNFCIALQGIYPPRS